VLPYHTLLAKCNGPLHLLWLQVTSCLAEVAARLAKEIAEQAMQMLQVSV
jgi:hypothetical protein